MFKRKFVSHAKSLRIFDFGKYIRFTVCYANPRATTEMLKIVDIMMYDEHRKVVLGGDFNADFRSEEGQDFIEVMRTDGLELRINLQL